MPLINIKFDHQGQTVTAEMYYDFNRLSNLVLIIPDENEQDLNETILLFREGKKWKTSSQTKQRFPQTFNNIIVCVNKELNIKSLGDHIISLLNFSS
jgi:hypothetical protein